jgi:hypothetical protein
MLFLELVGQVAELHVKKRLLLLFHDGFVGSGDFWGSDCV